MQQNFWLDPPVIRGVKIRWHQRQHACETGFWAGSRTGGTKPLLNFIVIAAGGIDGFPNCLTISEVFIIQPIYR